MFPRLFKAIKQQGDRYPAPAHDLVHDLTVAGYVMLVGRREKLSEDPVRMLVAAALCHSMDRRFHASEKNLRKRILKLLRETESLSENRCAGIADIVAMHKLPNNEDDSIELQVFKDADRLANLGLPAALRCGQHYHSLPTFNWQFVTTPDPTASYRDPKTVLHDVRSALEWDPREGKIDFCLRTRTAIRLARPYFDWLRRGLGLTDQQIREARVIESLP